MHGTEELVTERTRSGATWSERDSWVARGVSTYVHVVVDHAHGAEIWDVDGKHYIDFAGGIGTLNVGHTPEPVVEAIREQAGILIHNCFSVAIYEPYVELARRLCEIVPGEFRKKAMLVNSGAEAVENAVKISRAYTGRPEVISFRNSFHGRTFMGMSLTGKDKPYKIGFGPFDPHVHHADFPYAYRATSGEVADGSAIEQMLREEVPASEVAAIIVEPVQGEGGFVEAPAAFLRKLREICTREGIVLIADEVQTGYGRTGKMFAVEHAGVQPDLVVLAKSMAAGMPLGAVVGRAEVMDGPGLGGIGGTYGGNPLACRAALAVLDMFADGTLLSRASQIGDQIRARFREMQSHFDLIGDVRGPGAMVAIELVRDRVSKEPAPAETSEVIHRCHEQGLLIIKAGMHDNVIRTLVPLVINDGLLNEGLDVLESQLAVVSKG
jgi:4-aminobutyrate aminotransferase / (S)-3-amino-2-methylpropionate transaminase / 5-aminovalerate transaminase